MTRLRPLLHPLAFTLLALALLAPASLGHEVLTGRDLLPHFYPRVEAALNAIAGGDVARWNPWCDHGASRMGPRGMGPLYPLYLPFAGLPLPLAMALFVALHYLIALEGARRWLQADTPGWPATLGALAYGLGGFLTSQYWALQYLVSAAWLPWGLAAGRAAARDPLRGAVGVGVVCALTLLAAEPQGALAIGALAFVTAVQRSPAEQRRRVGLYVGVGVALSAAAAAPAVLSLLDELPRSNRALTGYADLRWGFSVGPLLDLLIPGVLGEPRLTTGGYWGYSVWSGDVSWCGLAISSLGLAACVSALRAPSLRSARNEGFALVVLGYGLHVLGDDLQNLRFSAKWLVLAALGLARLVAVGGALWARGERLAPARRFLAVFAVVQVALLLVVALAGARLEQQLAAINPRVDGAAARGAILQALLCAAAFTAPAWLWVRFVATRGAPGPGARALAVGLVAGQLLIYGASLTTTTATDVLGEPPIVKLLARCPNQAGAPIRYGGDPHRILRETPLEEQPGLTRGETTDLIRHLLLQPNVFYRFGIRGIKSFESSREGAYERLTRDPRFALLSPAQRNARIDGAILLFTADELAALPKRARAELVAFRPGVVEGVHLVQNLACPPWAYVVADAAAVTSVERGLDLVFSPTHRPRRKVVLGPEGVGDQEGPIPGTRARAGVRVVVFETEAIVLEVVSDADAWLVVREAFHPDWSARLNGESVPQYRADGLYRAIRVPQGTSTVRFDYDPWWWPVGVRLAAFAWLLLLGCLVVPHILPLGVRGAAR